LTCSIRALLTGHHLRHRLVGYITPTYVEVGAVDNAQRGRAEERARARVRQQAGELLPLSGDTLYDALWQSKERWLIKLFVYVEQDVEGALSPAEISDKLGLAGGEKGREWSVRGSCATKGDGLEEGLDWLVQTMQK
jgi:hypothetical protein